MSTARKLFRETAVLLRLKWRLWLAMLVVATAGAIFIYAHDSIWIKHVIAANNPAIHKLAQKISFWGDFFRGWLILIGFIALLGWLVRKPALRICALAALLAGLSAGAQTQLLSSLIGRPRPSVTKTNQLQGLTLARRYKSFPSSHTSCAFAVATTLAANSVALSPFYFGAAAAVGWSRMALKAHYPSDVWAGMWFGIINGLLFGLAARRTSMAHRACRGKNNLLQPPKQT
ncbi:MAG: phosphatase PAP2 family protein [Verrucomicrobiae bacterium]|nr:phosphatase PAP2 family protein [Verrucomicrobiae bacterium]